MAEIATYQCSSNKCRFTVRLSHDFPLWHSKTPKHLRSLTVTPAARGYVTGYRSDIYCKTCKQVFTDTGARSCRNCGEHLHNDLAMQTCPQCKKARVLMPHLMVR